MSEWDFGALDTAIEAWLRTLAGTDPNGVQVPVRESAKPQKMSRSGVEVQYEITNIDRMGRDWTAYAQDVALPVGSDYVPEQHAVRRFVLSVTAESTNASPGWSARHFLERIRVRLRKPSSLETLRDAGIALLRDEAIIEAPMADVGERRLSKAALDLHFSTHVTDKDDEGATSWIEKGILTTELKHPDGSSAPGNVTDKTIPPE